MPKKLPIFPKTFFTGFTELVDLLKREPSAATRWNFLDKMSASKRYSMCCIFSETAPEVVAVDPAYWAKTAKWMEKYKRGHAQEIAEKEAAGAAAYEARKNKQHAKLKALYGGDFESLVAWYLKACHAGEISVSVDNSPIGPGLLEMVYLSVYSNRPEILRQIANAIPRVHKLAEGEGETFKVKYANPVLCRIIKNVGGTLPTKTREITETARGLGLKIDENGNVKDYSERSARRLRHMLGLPSLPRGRPRNNPEIIRPTIP